jgi:hypothetical protein
VLRAIEQAHDTVGKPTMIILHTVKGKGVSFAEQAGYDCHSMPVTEQLRELGSRISALIGTACSIVCLVIFGPQNFIIPSMILILFVLTVMKGRLKGSAGDRTLNDAGSLPELNEAEESEAAANGITAVAQESGAVK